ncbi:LysR family transcriptional regulator [Klebsiella aerogenes]|nr:LysR family transcriptional regulator [Klebsiella aerogenes]
MLANLEVKWLYDVIALEESRSFTLAAKARNISQSSFSRRIQSLEASLGFSIFDRSANPLQLTNRGKIFVGYARNMLDDMDFQISRIKGLNNTTQKIRIDAAPSLSVLLLPEIIAGYTDRKNKTFHVESINVNDAVFNLKEGKSDFILSFYNEELMNYPFINHKIFDSYLHLVSPCDEHGRPLFHLHRGVLPLMKYANDSYMGAPGEPGDRPHAGDHLLSHLCFFHERAAQAHDPQWRRRGLAAAVLYSARAGRRPADDPR